MQTWKLPLLLDGATGTNLMRAGMPMGVCTEQWILDHPAPLSELQKAYAAAGSDAVMAPTFEANRYKLSRFGLGDRVEEINRRLVALSRSAVGDKVLVAGDMAPTGQMVEPFGEATFASIVENFREQAFALKKAGVDYIAVETMMSLTEARAALLAAKETGLPVTVSLTVEKNGRTLSGGRIEASLLTLRAMGADAVGVNCSTGPEAVLAALKAAAPYVDGPLLAKPNAGLPREGEPGIYDVTPETFAAYAPQFLALGAELVGGCCGTTPEHIALLRKAFESLSPSPKVPSGTGRLLAADERHIYEVTREELADAPELVCDEELADNLSALAEDGAAAACVRINCMEEIEELKASAYLAQLPLIFLSQDAEVLEAALAVYQGRAVLKTCPGIAKEVAESLAARYGALLLS